MENTKFKAKVKTWWIIEGENACAGVMEPGSEMESGRMTKFFTNEAKWKSELSKIPNIEVFGDIKK